MNRDNVEFSITGNFQYDAGLLGLVNIVKDFDLEDRLNFTICDNTITFPREMMPVIGQLGYLYGFVAKGELFSQKPTQCKNENARQEPKDKIKKRSQNQ